MDDGTRPEARGGRPLGHWAIGGNTKYTGGRCAGRSRKEGGGLPEEREKWEEGQ